MTSDAVDWLRAYRVGDLGHVVLGQAVQKLVAKGAVVQQPVRAVGLNDGHVLQKLLHRLVLLRELDQRELLRAKANEKHCCKLGVCLQFD
jgi:hypothetical protein